MSDSYDDFLTAAEEEEARDYQVWRNDGAAVGCGLGSVDAMFRSPAKVMEDREEGESNEI